MKKSKIACPFPVISTGFCCTRVLWNIIFKARILKLWHYLYNVCETVPPSRRKLPWAKKSVRLYDQKHHLLLFQCKVLATKGTTVYTALHGHHLACFSCFDIFDFWVKQDRQFYLVSFLVKAHKLQNLSYYRFASFRFRPISTILFPIEAKWFNLWFTALAFTER